MSPPEPIPIIACTVWKPAFWGSDHGSRKLKTRARRYGSIQMEAMPAVRASVVAPARTRPGTPATTRIPSIINISAIVVPRSGSTTISAAKRQVTMPDRLPELSERPRRSVSGEVRGRPDQQSDLGQLRRLERERPRGEPALGAVDLGSDHEHRETESERHEHERRREESQPAMVEAGEEEHQRDTGERIDPLAFEERDRIAVSERGGGRGRAVDHDESEGHEPERDEDEQTLLELTSIHPLRFSTSLLNSSPRCSKSRNWS